jgi:hypothetical protein
MVLSGAPHRSGRLRASSGVHLDRSNGQPPCSTQESFSDMEVQWCDHQEHSSVCALKDGRGLQLCGGVTTRACPTVVEALFLS